LARKGKSVILVDFDLRSPAIAENMNLESGQFGTIDVLMGRARIDEALIQYKRLPLGILTGGEGISDTMHILNTSAVEKIINELRELADYVILDTPPSGMLADASLIARHVDTALFVVRQDYAHIPDIIEGISNLYEENIPICGCVLNHATVGITGYGYGYGYGYGGRYGYGYGRGYGYGKEKRKK
ncbi:MAG: CpsD/CapB family tyrosine-protein kinase, partial [Eubacterium sp.]|nr:CpsD/CapB family tyrosine-protein kinase [Eubacterium sp.]